MDPGTQAGIDAGIAAGNAAAAASSTNPFMFDHSHQFRWNQSGNSSSSDESDEESICSLCPCCTDTSATPTIPSTDMTSNAGSQCTCQQTPNAKDLNGSPQTDGSSGSNSNAVKSQPQRPPSYDAALEEGLLLPQQTLACRQGQPSTYGTVLRGPVCKHHCKHHHCHHHHHHHRRRSSKKNPDDSPGVLVAQVIAFIIAVAIMAVVVTEGIGGKSRDGFPS